MPTSQLELKRAVPLPEDLSPPNFYGNRKPSTLWEPYKNEWHDAAWVEKKYGVPPSQLADYLALIGDRTDGVPGVTGIGASKAAHLLRSYHSLEGILAGAGILMDRVGTALRRERQPLLLSRELVALKTNAVLGVTWRQLTVEPR